MNYSNDKAKPVVRQGRKATGLPFSPLGDSRAAKAFYALADFCFYGGWLPSTNFSGGNNGVYAHEKVQLL